MSARETDDRAGQSGDATEAPTPADAYERPRLLVLGSVQELTQGGVNGTFSDGFGTAGAAGSIS